MSAITIQANRRLNDFYPTPAFATEQLLELVHVEGIVNECCSGDEAIAKPLRARGLEVCTNDINGSFSPDYCGDACNPEEWRNWSAGWGMDWTITNPPFNRASEIIPLAYEYSRVGIAMLLRLSYLEPCRNRAQWLIDHPVNHLIITPRISFTGDGKSDSVTTAWMVWIKGCDSQRITVLPGK